MPRKSKCHESVAHNTNEYTEKRATSSKRNETNDYIYTTRVITPKPRVNSVEEEMGENHDVTTTEQNACAGNRVRRLQLKHQKVRKKPCKKAKENLQ
jgi:hypothetical protein